MSPRVNTTVGTGLSGRSRFDDLLHLFEELGGECSSDKKLPSEQSTYLHDDGEWYPACDSPGNTDQTDEDNGLYRTVSRFRCLASILSDTYTQSGFDEEGHRCQKGEQQQCTNPNRPVQDGKGRQPHLFTLFGRLNAPFVD